MAVGITMGTHNRCRGIDSRIMDHSRGSVAMDIHTSRGSIAMNFFGFEYLGRIHGWYMLLVKPVALVIIEVALNVEGPAIGLQTMAT